MRFIWPEDTVFHRLVLDVEQECCEHCGRDLHICDHRIRHLYTLAYPLELCCRLTHCSDPACLSRPHTLSPAAELSLALPGCLIGWDVFCFIGHRRFARHWSVPQIRDELCDGYAIRLSPDAISNYIHRYQNMLAARQQDFANLQRAYQDIDSVDLTIDGLQPEKGHETLYAVRELKAKRVWFAEALLSSNEAEVRRLLARAGAMAKQLGKSIRLWMSDKQDAFVKGIAAEFSGIPHLYCGNHFLRDLAKPTLASDSAAKVQMRKKVRGLRAIEREVLQQREQASNATTPASRATNSREATAGAAPADEVASSAEPERTPTVTAEVERVAAPSKAGQDGREGTPEEATVSQSLTTLQRSGDGAAATAAGAVAALANGQTDSGVARAAERAGGVVLDYCAAVRGILNDDQGGPLHPPGVRMAEALTEVRESLQRNLDLNKPGSAHSQLERLAGCIDRGLEAVKAEQQQVKEQVKEIQRVAETVDVESGTREQRQEKYEELQKEFQEKGGEFYDRMVKVMMAWAAGLFMKVACTEGEKVPVDNLDLERWFRNPKGHERRIHGHKHAGVRIVQEGPTLLLALDAHLEHDGPFTAEELIPYRHAQPPKDQQEAINRRTVMRKARSKKNDEHCSEI
jgi:prefoldin subunit 5